MSKITFILGGARSGKSAYAAALARKTKGAVAFVATCIPRDDEMKQRVVLHQQTRPKHWQTFEAETNLAEIIKKLDNKFDLIIVDCLTLLVSNLIFTKNSDADIVKKIIMALDIIKFGKSKMIIVSNEVGLSIVPETALGRRFRDIAGKINQLVADKADKVFFMISGLAMKLK